MYECMNIECMWYKKEMSDSQGNSSLVNTDLMTHETLIKICINYTMTLKVF